MGGDKDLPSLALPREQNWSGHPEGKEASSTSKDCPLLPACAWLGCRLNLTLPLSSRVAFGDFEIPPDLSFPSCTVPPWAAVWV